MRAAAASRAAGAIVAAALFSGACAARLPPRPSGAATPAPDALELFTRATAHCEGLRTMTSELSLSGHAGDERLRGRVIAGLERGGRARLEGVAPFGAPIFILAARDERATLLLPRDRRVLQDAAVGAVIERLTGLPLGADDLRGVLAGCPGAGAAQEGRSWPGGWRAVGIGDGRTAFLRERSGQWTVVAVDAGAWRADYATVVNGYPREVRLRTTDGAVDVIARVAQLEVNTDIDAAAFDVEVPPGTEPMTLDELRSVAPLRTP
ncbi:MAG: hypothetical protein R2712_06095 [Vicinamibacterales bacterium]